MSVDQVEAKVLHAERAFARAKPEIAVAHSESERHQLFLDRHRVVWSEDVRLYESLRNHRLRTQTIKRLALGLLLIGPIVGVALWHLIARLSPRVRNLLFGGIFWLYSQGKRIQTGTTKHLSAWHRSHAGKYQAKSDYRIPGLDGPLCIGQPSSPNVTRASELSLLQIRLVVAWVGVTMVGFLAAAVTPDLHKEQSQLFPTADAPAGQYAPVAQAKEIEASAPDAISGFAVLAAAPADDPVSLPAVSVGEIIFITRPLDEALEQDNWEMTPPDRKPKIRPRPKIGRDQAKQKPKVSLWEQLPWVH